MRRALLALAVFTAVIGAGLYVGLAGAQSTDEAPPLAVVPARPLPNEALLLTGRFSTPSRPVQLQVWDGQAWRPLSASTTDRRGQFSFTERAQGASRRFRVVAPRTTVWSGWLPRRHGEEVTEPVEARTVEPTMTLSFVPSGAVPQSTGAEVVATARFSPPRPGREVVLERKISDTWKAVEAAKQDAAGQTRFVLPEDVLGEVHAYRATARPQQGAAPVSSAEVAGGDASLVWSDEFTGASLDPEKWSHRHLGRQAGSRMCAESASESVRVADGTLRMRVLPKPGAGPSDRCPHGEYLNGHIGTEGKFEVRYGVLAARIKFPRQQGQHGAFWAQPIGEPDPTGWVAGGAEIDIVEYFGDGFNNGAIQHSIYWGGEQNPHKLGGQRDLNHLLPAGEQWSDDFHVFSVEWTPDEYVFRIDGRETMRAERGVSRIPQYLILSLLTSDWELAKLDANQLTEMEVDWVRVWRTRPVDASG